MSYLFVADDSTPTPASQDAQPALEWLQFYESQQTGSAAMMFPPNSPEAGDTAMQEATEQPEPELAAHRGIAQPEKAKPSSNICGQAPESDGVAPSAVDPSKDSQASAQLHAVTMCRLQKVGFNSKEAAMIWLSGDGYTRAKAALLPLGVTESSDIALLHAQQLLGIRGLKAVIRSKIRLILEPITDAERLQMVFQQHHSWLEEHLGMEVAGNSFFASDSSTVYWSQSE